MLRSIHLQSFLSPLLWLGLVIALWTLLVFLPRAFADDRVSVHFSSALWALHLYSFISKVPCVGQVKIIQRSLPAPERRFTFNSRSQYLHSIIASFREGSCSRASMYPTLPHMGRQLGRNLYNDSVTKFTAVKLLASKLLSLTFR